MTPREQNITKARLYLEMAQEDLDLVPKVIELGFPRAATSRAYYAAFYAASAILALEGLEFKKHSAVISTIGRDYIGKKGISKEHHQRLRLLFRERGKSDYDVVQDRQKTDPALFLKYATEWVHLAKNILKETTKMQNKRP